MTYETVSPFGLLVGDLIPVALVGSPDRVPGRVEKLEVVKRNMTSLVPMQVRAVLSCTDGSGNVTRFVRWYRQGEVVAILPRPVEV